MELNLLKKKNSWAFEIRVYSWDNVVGVIHWGQLNDITKKKNLFDVLLIGKPFEHIVSVES